MNADDDFPSINPSVPSVARWYAYMLGDEENCFESDRTAANNLEDIYPGSFAVARNNRRFLERLVGYLVTDCGIRQFIDHGSGLPTANNVHQIAQGIDPACRVVYVESDPVVRAHALHKALLARNTAFVEEDLRNVEAIINHPNTQKLIDFNEPVGVLFVSILHCIPDEADPRGVLLRAMDAVPAGSYLGISHLVSEDPAVRAEITTFILSALGEGNWGRVRTKQDLRNYVKGFEPVPPGLADIRDWHPTEKAEPQNPKWTEFGGLLRKP